MKILIIGHARHGKDTVANLIRDHFNLKFTSTSLACAEIFIYNKLKEIYNYDSPMECYEDRSNHRKEWNSLISDYNKNDKARFAKELVKTDDIYVGMRCDLEINKCREQNVFDLIIGVYDPRKPLESNESFKIDLWSQSDIIIPNSQGLNELEKRVKILLKPFINFYIEQTQHKVPNLSGEFPGSTDL